MSKYICNICGYVYDESTNPPFDSLPSDWKCPLCGAPKSEFSKEADENQNTALNDISVEEHINSNSVRSLSNRELAAICSNLARGCEKQYKTREANLFKQISDYYTARMEKPNEISIDKLKSKLQNELKQNYVLSNRYAKLDNDRGALRALAWSEKVTKILISILDRYEKEGNSLLDNCKIWVCDICGFVFIGDKPPAICPVCKVPSFKILEVM